MTVSDNEILMDEYVKTYFYTFRMLEISGFCRFIIRNGKIVERTSASLLYSILIMIMIDCGAAVMLCAANKDQTLSTVEFVAIVYFAIMSNLLLYHITFVEKQFGTILIYNFIKLDCYLGTKETEFIRNQTFKIYKYSVILTLIVQFAMVVQMFYIFDVSIVIHIFGTLYFFWIICAYDEYCFMLYQYWCLASRTRYLNVALMKITNMKMEYLPKQWLFHKLFWTDNYDDCVTFHIRNKKFCKAFKMIFDQFEHVQQCGRFPLILAMSTVVMGSFMTVQTFIMYIQASTAIARASVITCWVIASWFFLLVCTMFPDMFYNQIEQTKLICAYVQLKPTSSDAMLKLTKDVLATLELKDARPSIYNLCYFDMGFILKLAASTFVYITMQLQLAFPNLEAGYKVDNVSKPTMYELDYNTVKEIFFLY